MFVILGHMSLSLGGQNAVHPDHPSVPNSPYLLCDYRRNYKREEKAGEQKTEANKQYKRQVWGPLTFMLLGG